MADRYYDAQATGANNGTSKTDAFEDIVSAANAMSASGGDTLWCSHTSTETKTAHLAVDFGNGNRIICVDFSGSTPPVSADWTTGCVISGGTAWDITFFLSAYVFGIKFIAGDDLISNCNRWEFEQCELSRSGNADNLLFTAGELILINCIYSGGGVDHEILLNGGGSFIMYGGSISFPVGALATLVRSNLGYGVVEFHGTDLSNGGNGINEIYDWSGTGAVQRARIIFDSCNVDPSIVSSIITDSAQIDFYGSYNGDVPYFIQEESFYGVIQSETTIIKSGGSSDGTTPISLKFTGNANNTSGGMGVLLDMPIYFWVDSTGNQTFELELLTDGVTLTEADIIMELIYPQAGASKKVRVSSRSFDDANLPASSVTWATGGLGSPNKQKISMTVNIGQVGVVQARLRMVKANTIVYADIKLLTSSRQHLVGQAYLNSESVACDYPAVGKVIKGIVYDSGGLTGTYLQTVEADVRDGTFFGEDDTEFEGELVPTTVAQPLEIVEIDTLEVIEL